MWKQTAKPAEMNSGQELINREEEFETNFDMGYGISGGQKKQAVIYPLKRCPKQESSPPNQGHVGLVVHELEKVFSCLQSSRFEDIYRSSYLKYDSCILT